MIYEVSRKGSDTEGEWSYPIGFMTFWDAVTWVALHRHDFTNNRWRSKFRITTNTGSVVAKFKASHVLD